MKRTASVLIVIAVLLSFTACGAKIENDTQSTNEGETVFETQLANDDEFFHENNVSSKNTDETTLKKNNTDSQTATQKPNDSVVTTTQKKENSVGTFQLIIECHEAVAKGYHEKPEWKGIIPSSGIMFDEQISYQEGDSFLNALMRGHSEKYTIRKRGEYITGVNGLTEGVFTGVSGWTFLVNGEMPGGLSTGQYKIVGNEKITLKYVC